MYSFINTINIFFYVQSIIIITRILIFMHKKTINIHYKTSYIIKTNNKKYFNKYKPV